MAVLSSAEGHEKILSSEDNITPQVRAAHKTGVLIKVEPQRVEDINFGSEKFPVFIIPLGKFRGVIPVYETGTGIFDGTKEEFLQLPEHEQGEIRRRMIGLLTSERPFDVKVMDIDGEIAFLSRKEALKTIRRQTLKHLGVEDIKEVEGKVVKATVIALKNDRAVLDIGGFEAYLPRFDIDYTNPYPARVLKVGQVIDVKVMEVTDDGIRVNRKVLLPDPWENLDYKEGSVVSAVVLKPQKNGRGYVVAFEPGVTGIARNFFSHYIPRRFEKVAVRIDVINRENRYIIGRIIV